jgi:glutamyl-tRNA reductase
MALHVLGINHRSAPLEVREKLAFPSEAQGEALADLAAQPGVAEAVLVSTCNRTEVYCRADDEAAIRTWLERQAPSGSRPASTPWCWASRRSWAR